VDNDGDDMKIVQVIGFKNSGKTTFSVELIKTFVNKGFQTASLKHHGHGGLPLGIENTDNFKHFQAGATLSGVQGENVLQFIINSEWDIYKMIQIYRLLNTEVLVLEGYKGLDYQKVVLIKDMEDLHLLSEKNIIAIISDIQLDNSLISGIPIFNRSEKSACCELIYQSLFEVN